MQLLSELAFSFGHDESKIQTFDNMFHNIWYNLTQFRGAERHGVFRLR